MLMHYVKSSDRGLQARRDGGPRARDMLGAHVAASPQVRSHAAAHGQRKDGRGGGFARRIAPVVQCTTSFHAFSAAGTKLVVCAASMTGELMCIARGARDHHDTLRAAQGWLESA